MPRLDGKVALITGAARGQGRGHAVRFAEEGAAIIAIDACDTHHEVPYPLPTPGDLEETGRLVEAINGRVITAVADIRDQQALDAVVANGMAEFGRLDVVVANAGICTGGWSAWDMPDDSWQAMLDINLTGQWRTIKAAAPKIIDGRSGGSVILTSSFSGLRGEPFIAHYVAAKHGVVGLMRSLAHELGPHNIRVNTINPGNARTPMIDNDYGYKLMCPDLEQPGHDDMAKVLRRLTLLDVDFIEISDLANAALFLASDESRYITGVMLPVDAGWSAKGF